MNEHSQRPVDASDPAPSTPTPIGDFLRSPADGTHHAPPHLWGFGGLHGGLALATMASAMQAAETTHTLRSITGRLFRTVRDPFIVDVSVDSATRSTSAYTAQIRLAPGAPSSNGILASATAMFGADGDSALPLFAPAAPAVPSWTAGTAFRPPPGFVPVSEYTEIRPVSKNLPFTGGKTPKLTAWVRLVEDDLPPDELRLLFLVDALAPSYAAVLPAPRPVPTVELSVHFSGHRAASPWILVDAHTTVATEGGWITETINAWDEEATHLVEARQLRLVRPAQAP